MVPSTPLSAHPSCTGRPLPAPIVERRYLLDPSSQDHYCTQSDPAPGGGVAVCARDFVDYDANALAVAAGVPATPAAANAVLARMDRGSCTVRGGGGGTEVQEQCQCPPLPPPHPTSTRAARPTSRRSTITRPTASAATRGEEGRGGEEKA